VSIQKEIIMMKNFCKKYWFFAGRIL